MGTLPSWWGPRPAGCRADQGGPLIRRMATGGATALALVGALAFTGCRGNIGPSGAGASVGLGGGGSIGTGNGGASGSGVGVGGAGAGSGTAGVGGPGTGGTAPVVYDCNTILPGRSPLRRLTTYEYDNTVRDLLGDMTHPGSQALPPQVDTKQNL